MEDFHVNWFRDGPKIFERRAFQPEELSTLYSVSFLDSFLSLLTQVADKEGSLLEQSRHLRGIITLSFVALTGPSKTTSWQSSVRLALCGRLLSCDLCGP